MDGNWDLCWCKLGSFYNTILIDEGAVVFEDKLSIELNVSVLAHPAMIGQTRGGWTLAREHLFDSCSMDTAVLI